MIYMYMFCYHDFENVLVVYMLGFITSIKVISA